MDKVIVIAGPTASGKTKVSIELAKAINGEIISADSMQIYKHMDIGTAKPSHEEKQGIIHHLIDEIEPEEEFSVAKYQSLALDYIDKILKGNKVPIVVGGTGLYINSLIYNIQFTDIKTNWELRKKLQLMAEEKGKEYLHKELKKLDPKAAQRIHKNDIKRIVRALEVYKTTNKSITYYQELSRSKPPEYKFIIFGLKTDRKILYERINRRVDQMVEAGLISEVEDLRKMGYDKYHIPMQGLGYKEILWYLEGEATREEVISLLKRDTRRYAKRQLTWFNKIESIYWLDVEEGHHEIVNKITEIFRKYG